MECERALSNAMDGEHDLKKRVKELHFQLRTERDKKKQQKRQMKEAEKKVNALSRHIEKLMVALKMQAKTKAKQVS